MVRPTCYIQTDRVGAGGGPDDGGGLLPNTEPVVADDPPKTDDNKVEAGSDPDGRWGRGSRIQRNAECSLLGCNLKLGLAAI